jgi:hypothetical protein
MGLNKLSSRAGAAPTRGGGESLVGRILLVILACSAALLVTGCSGADAAAQEEAEEEAEASSDRPNIIFVLADDLDYASAQKMPQIGSSLAEEGLSFEKASSAIRCAAPPGPPSSLASMITTTTS